MGRIHVLDYLYKPLFARLETEGVLTPNDFAELAEMYIQAVKQDKTLAGQYYFEWIVRSFLRAASLNDQLECLYILNLTDDLSGYLGGLSAGLYNLSDHYNLSR